MKRDIENLDDIKRMLNRFYGKVKKDDLIGPIFQERIQDHWAEHMEKIYQFWQSVLLKEQTYQGFAFPPHANLPIDKEHFDRWLSLFDETVDALYEGEVANEAKFRAHAIAEVFQNNLREIRSRKKQPPHFMLPDKEEE